MNETIQKLQKQIEELQSIVMILLEWKLKKETQQISYPLDKNSRDIINNP